MGTAIARRTYCGSRDSRRRIAKLIDERLTTSLNSSVTDYKYEHGRRYHAYQEGKYVLPNDDAEIERLGEL